MQIYSNFVDFVDLNPVCLAMNLKGLFFVVFFYYTWLICNQVQTFTSQLPSQLTESNALFLSFLSYDL